MALITGSDVDFAGTTGDPWPNAGGTDWDTYTYRGTAASYISNNRGGSGTSNYTHQRFMKSGAQPSDANYEIRGTFYIGSGAANDRFLFIYIRMASGADTSYRFAVSATTWSISKFLAGVWSSINSGSISLAKDATHTFKFSADGTSDVDLVGTINDVEIFSETELAATDDPIIAQGFAGISGYSAGTTMYGPASFELHTLSAPALSWGTVPDQQVTTGTVPTLSPALSTYVSGGTPPYTFDMVAGSEEITGSTLQSDGTFSGNATTDETKDLQFEVTDSAGSPETANSNIVTFTVQSTGNSPPSFDGPNIATQYATVGVAKAGVDVGSLFSDPTDTLTFSASSGTALPAGYSLVAGILTVAEGSLVAGTTTGHVITADDGVNSPVPSNAFDIVVSPASSATASVTTGELRNGAKTVLANTAVSWIWYPTDPKTALDAGTEVSGSGTTSAGGTLTTSATLPAGAGYILVYTAGWANAYMEALTAS